MASTWSSVSRLSKSSERHVSPLCDPQRLLLFGRSSESPPCDPGVPCGRSSDRLLLPTLLLAILASPVVDRQTVFFYLLASSLPLARSSFLVGRRPTLCVSCSPIRLLQRDVWPVYCFSVGGNSVSGSLSCSSFRLLLYRFPLLLLL